MLKHRKLFLLIFSIICLNGLIYIRALNTIEVVDFVFAECARNSGRIAAGLNLTILLMLGLFGLKSIFNEEKIKSVFWILTVLFAVNHLIHFFFVSQYFKDQIWDLDIYPNLHGFLIYISIIVLPIILKLIKNLNKVLYSAIIFHFFNVTYFISISFYSRYKPEDPAYLHRIGVLVMIGALSYVLYRIFHERSINLNSDNSIL